MDEMRVLASGLRFPEGPVAMRDGSVLFVEIAAGTLSRVNANGDVSLVAHLGGGPNGLAVGPDGALYVCNNGGLIFHEENGETRLLHGLSPSYTGGAIQRVDPVNGSVSTLYTHCGNNALRGPNDLVFDSHGGFYFTDFGKIGQRERDIGSVFYARPDGTSIVEVIHPISHPNGVGLSPDGRMLYVSETETARLWAFPVVSPGVLEKTGFPSPNGGRFVFGPAGYQRFDSLAVQANGDICVATLVTGHITVVSPEGELQRRVQFPDRQTTNICFGGSDLRKAYVTQSLTGKLIELDWHEAGLPLAFNA
jgi:gluconolactonase